MITNSKQKILIIDDEVEITTLLSRGLKREGYEVASANTMGTGKSLYKLIQPNLLLLDVNLPDGNGLAELPHFIKAIPNCKIIMMSAFDSNDLRTTAYNAGAFAFLGKPYTLQQITELINKAFNN